MANYLGLNRVCVPLSLDCDLSCRYCYRAVGRLPVIPDFNALMRDYLNQLDPTKTQALVASGGEPLLRWDKVEELFSYAPKGQHKKVMTNGLNLTPEIVEYLNRNKVETWVSYDGNVTEWLRGVDVLADPELYDLITQIDHLTFSCCLTAKNPDPWKCYQEIKAKVPRHFYFHFNPVFSDKHLPKELIDGFDYKAYQSGLLHCALHDLDWHNPIPHGYRGVGCNVLPNGDVCGMAEIHHKYGTVLSPREEIVAKKREYGDLMQCEDKDCPVNGPCNQQGQNKSPHFCECTIRKMSTRMAIRAKERDSDD